MRRGDHVVVWRYGLEINKWFKGPAMITPQVMYGCIIRGTYVFRAGGIRIEGKNNNTSEKYNAETKAWTVIHEMHNQMKFCPKCFFHNKFHVVNDRNENDEYLTCGESTCNDPIRDPVLKAYLGTRLIFSL